MSVGNCTCDTRDRHPVSECVPPGPSNDETFTEDVRAIAAALGLGDHARPYSAHAVVHRELLPAIVVLHALATEMVNDPDASAADYGYELAYRLGHISACTCRAAFDPTCPDHGGNEHRP